ncbi:cell cycle regulator of non-homologous end joining isoform X2 [Etheostoma spectabile]|uniref:cell cycle regulator of non-homologous end joining isoform X2 n=1 Tax=Etheostoma spectabile TaxID=54343 RepID=UPI0013AFBF85|nr:cell cycle regulator of non-homologous end joining-like isoform X2 [Etheostoma spectabile]
MSERPRRVLPPWMAKKEDDVKKEPLKSRRRQKTTRAAFYCMNEKELVEAAVSYLSDAACPDVDLLTDQKVEDKAIVKLVTLEEESSDCNDAPEKTYVSETDSDIPEVETVPYTKSPQHQGPGGQRSALVQDRAGLVNVGLEAEEKEEHSQMPAEEDDAMRLVREIFFT